MSTATLQRRRGLAETFLSDQLYPGDQPERTCPTPMVPQTSMEAESQLKMRFGDNFLIFESKPNDWILPTLQHVCQLGTLRQNWDSYGGRPVDLESAAATVTLLLNVLQPDDPIPAIVPTCRGGILLEWHESGIDLEIDIRSPSWFHVAVEENDRMEEFDRADIEVVEEKLNVLRGRFK